MNDFTMNNEYTLTQELKEYTQYINNDRTKIEQKEYEQKEYEQNKKHYFTDKLGK